jgi:hypothetical protein
VWIVGASQIIMGKNDIETQIPPRCPHCDTELKEEKNFLGGYTWKCIRNDFKKRSKRSFYSVVDDIDSLAFNDWEHGRIS